MKSSQAVVVMATHTSLEANVQSTVASTVPALGMLKSMDTALSAGTPPLSP